MTLNYPDIVKNIFLFRNVPILLSVIITDLFNVMFIHVKFEYLNFYFYLNQYFFSLHQLITQVYTVFDLLLFDCFL